MMPIGLGVLLVSTIGVLLAPALMKSAGPTHTGVTSPLQKQDLSPPVQVLLYKETKPGAITYGYRVVNGSGFEVSTLLIGFDYFTGSPELRVVPSGWDGSSVPSTSFRAPSGWQFELTPTEDDSSFNVEWAVDSVTTGLIGGNTLAGFEVTVPQADPRYESGHWTVYLKSAEQSYFSGSIDASGTTGAPPSSVFGPNGVRVKPNPTHGGVTIEFASPSSGTCSIDILDAAGRSVRRMAVTAAQGGQQRAVWDGLDNGGRRLAPASYFVWIRTPTTQRFARFVLQR